MKTTAAWLSLLVLFAISCKKDVENSSALSAIPLQSAVVVRVNNFENLRTDLKQASFGDALIQSMLFTELADFLTQCEKLDTNKLKISKAFGAWHVSGAGKYNWIWSVESTDLTFVDANYLNKKGTITERPYAETKIFEFSTPDLTFFFARANGLVIISTSENLVESSLKQLQNKIDLASQPAFMQALKTANSKDPINAFIQFSALPDWLETLLNSRPNWLENLGEWSALDLDINTNNITLTGITLSPDSTGTYLSLFEKTGSQTIEFQNIVPENCALVTNQNSKNMGAFGKAFRQYLGVHNRLKKRDNALHAINVDEGAWHNTLAGEMGTFFVDGAQDVAHSKYAYLKLNEGASAKALLEKISNPNPEIYRDKFIYQLSARNVLPLLFGHIFSDMPLPYWYEHNGWLLFANDAELAKNHINNLLIDKVLANNNSYLAVAKNLDSDAHLLVLAKSPDWLNLLEKSLKPDLAKRFTKEKGAWQSINWVMAEFTQRKEAAYTALSLVKQEETTAQAKQYFTTKLEARAAKPAQLVKNHNTKQNEVVIQDENNTLYLISPQGKILWKRTLEDEILGEIAQIDIYKNQKLQLVFNTKTHLYVVDRNGKDVAPFPIKLKEAATAPMAVLDYEKNRNYRLLVPCGKQLLNYDVTGKEVNGWNFSKAKTDLVTQPKWRVLSGKDLIYLADQKGRVYVVNRRGEARYKLKTTLSSRASEIYLMGKSTNEAQFVALSRSGYQLKLSLNDQLDSLQPFGEKPDYFVANGENMLFSSADYLYYRSNTQSFDIELTNALSAAPTLYFEGKTPIIAATCGEEVWVYFGGKKPLPGMPLYGTGAPILGKTAGTALQLLITTGDSNVLDYTLASQN